MNKYALGGAASIALALGLFLLLTGEKTRPDAVTPDGTNVQVHLLEVGNIYRLFQDSRRRSPASFEELVLFSRGLELDSALKEESLLLRRDKQPMVIRYGVKLSGPGKQGPIVAHEQTGFNGRRFVIYSGSTNLVEEVDEATFQKGLQ